MAVVRITPQGNTTNCLDGLCTAYADMTTDTRMTAAAVGSLMYCLEDGKLYCKTAENTWTEVQ